MSEFTASNGLEVWIDSRGELLTNRRLVGAGLVEETNAVREFVQAERDEELGRWRYPDDRDYVVYPVGSGEVVHVLNEKAGVSGQYERAEVNKVFGGEFLETADPVYSRAARAYFEAVRKPWEVAKPGEVWVVTFTTGPTFDEKALLVADFSVEGRVFADAEELVTLRLTDERIIAARRIWPESD